MAVSECGRHVVAAGRDGTLSLYRLFDGRKGQYWAHVGDTQGCSGEPAGLAFVEAPSLKLIAIGTRSYA